MIAAPMVYPRYAEWEAFDPGERIRRAAALVAEALERADEGRRLATANEQRALDLLDEALERAGYVRRYQTRWHR